jgi:hypothetical protein
MNILFWNDLNPLMKKKVLKRSDFNAQMIRQDTLNIIENVQQYQDEALQRYTLAFDKVALTNFQVSHNELLEAEKIYQMKNKKQSIALLSGSKPMHVPNYHKIGDLIHKMGSVVNAKPVLSNQSAYMFPVEPRL